MVHIHDLDFANDLREGYDEVLPLEEELKFFEQYSTCSRHIVIVATVWWGNMKAKFKGLIDRTFLSGFACKYDKGKAIPKKQLQGRTSD